MFFIKSTTKKTTTAWNFVDNVGETEIGHQQIRIPSLPSSFLALLSSSFSSLSSTTVDWSAESSCKLGLLNPLLSLTGSLGWNSINNHRTQVTWCVRSSLVSQPRRRVPSSSAMMRKKARRRRRLISAHTKEPTSSLWLEENNSQGNNIVRW